VLALTRPTEAAIGRWLARQQAAAFSYTAVGATRGAPPRGYIVSHRRIDLGCGADTYARACDALRAWAMFRLGWVEVFPAGAPLVVGTAVAVLAHLVGVWSLNACRIVYLIDEGGDVERFGFAYGTLPAHAVRGEERFSVEWNRADDVVTYDLFAFSRPGGMLTWLGLPLVRRLQRRFALDSTQAMARAVRR